MDNKWVVGAHVWGSSYITWDICTPCWLSGPCSFSLLTQLPLNVYPGRQQGWLRDLGTWHIQGSFRWSTSSCVQSGLFLEVGHTWSVYQWVEGVFLSICLPCKSESRNKDFQVDKMTRTISLGGTFILYKEGTHFAILHYSLWEQIERKQAPFAVPQTSRCLWKKSFHWGSWFSAADCVRGAYGLQAPGTTEARENQASTCNGCTCNQAALFSELYYHEAKTVV